MVVGVDVMLAVDVAVVVGVRVGLVVTVTVGEGVDVEVAVEVNVGVSVSTLWVSMTNCGGVVPSREEKVTPSLLSATSANV